jgi:hypothetical protein
MRRVALCYYCRGEMMNKRGEAIHIEICKAQERVRKKLLKEGYNSGTLARIEWVDYKENR